MTYPPRPLPKGERILKNAVIIPVAKFQLNAYVSFKDAHDVFGVVKKRIYTHNTTGSGYLEYCYCIDFEIPSPNSAWVFEGQLQHFISPGVPR